MKIITLFLALMLFLSCHKNDDDAVTPHEITGNYIGTFTRGDHTSKVTFQLLKFTFKGEGELQKFPALCHGKYSINEQTINFQNLCPWTAEFDSTLILSGTWRYSFNGKTLILNSENGDQYFLTRQHKLN